MTARRHNRRGEGSVYLDKSRTVNPWIACAPSPSRRKRSAPDRETAKRYLREMIGELEQTGTVAPKNATVASAVADLMAHPPASWKTDTTMRVNRGHADRLTAALGSVLLNRLTVSQVEDHLAAEGVRGCSRSTVADELRVLRIAIRRAQKNRLVTDNVAELADLPNGLKTRKSEPLTVEQVRQLFASDLTPWWRAYLMVAIRCGTRPGETGALCWEDIDGDVMVLRHGLQETDAGLVVGDMKNEHTHRSMKLPKAVAAALAAWKREQRRARLAAGPAWREQGLIFTDSDGGPVNRQKINRELRRVIRAAGIGRRVQPREMRHTFVTVLSHHGVPVENIADAVGHVNSNVTRSVYRHQLADVISDVATVMDGQDEATS